MNKICLAKDCDRKAISRNCCDMHYRRILLHGDINYQTVNRDVGDATERFHKKYKKETNGCWNWVGGTRPSGRKRADGTFRAYYGRHHDNYKEIGAHRFSYELHNGKIPKGMLVCHKCDNPLCVNPDHLFLGTHSDNMDDMMKKNRCCRTSGEDRWTSKFTNKQVKEMKKMYKSGLFQWQIAEKYNCGQVTVSRIVRGVHYKDA